MAADRTFPTYNYSNLYKQSGSDGNKSTNKVYINPYFNRVANVNISNSLKPNVMHVNPNFSQNSTREHKQKTKIYINPNFINPNNYIQKSENTQNKVFNNGSNIPTNSISTNQSLLPHTSINKYCLVRRTVNKISSDQTPHKLSTTVTLKVNKYKSVPMTDFKKNLEALNWSNRITKHSTQKVKQSVVSTQNTEKSTMPLHHPSCSSTNRSNFKLVKHNTQTVACKTGFTYRNLTLSRISSGFKLNPQKRINVIKKKFKTNNIPCPLFRKYGKCLRNTKGKCEFMHDKKHVSICRKFLKGMCHDRECLLSHDLTHKKMPTCYFYLKGICNKDDCPYLHVKLNEKTKICTDFLKGYCEKGDKCLNRHINTYSKIPTKGGSLKKQCQHLHTTNKKKVNEKNNQVLKRAPRVKRIKSKIDNSQDENFSSDRYYKEIINDDSVNEAQEIMKPTRCKLGTLPSFIQL